MKVYILSQLKLTPILWNDGVSYSNFFSLFNDAPIVSLKNLLGYCLLCIQIAYQGSNAWLSNILYIYFTLCIVSRICELKHIFFRSDIKRDYEKCIEESLLNFCCSTTSLSLKHFPLCICKVNIERLLVITRYDGFSSRCGFPIKNIDHRSFIKRAVKYSVPFDFCNL